MFGAFRQNGSIAARLLLSAIACSVLVLVIAGVLLSNLHRRASEQAFDQRLDAYLRSIVADIASPGDDTRTEPGQLGEPQFELPLSGWYWQITRLDTLKPEIKTSRSLFAVTLPSLADLGVPAGIGGSRRGLANGPDNQPIRIVEREIEVADSASYLVQVAAATDDVEYDISRFRAALAATFSVLALALAGATVLQVRFGLRPLRRLREEVGAIRRGESEKIAGAFPLDIAPLAGELNLLIDSNREILERARTQVGNLAHALKTPLSVIANETRADASPLAAKVSEQSEIMRVQMTWYLDRARAAGRSGVIGAVTEVEPVAAGLTRAFAKIYDARAVEFTLEAPPGLRFRGERQDLEEMIGNLADNAGKWAKSAVEIHAAAAPGPAQSTLEVTIDDDGPGLPAGQRAEALTRGRRLDETKPGSGLGLSIVADLAALYGGALTLEVSPLGGLRARLRLPSA